MPVQREMAAVERDSGIDEHPYPTKQGARERPQAAPEEPMMHDEEVGAA